MTGPSQWRGGLHRERVRERLALSEACQKLPLHPVAKKSTAFHPLGSTWPLARLISVRSHFTAKQTPPCRSLHFVGWPSNSSNFFFVCNFPCAKLVWYVWTRVSYIHKVIHKHYNPEEVKECGEIVVFNQRACAFYQKALSHEMATVQLSLAHRSGANCVGLWSCWVAFFV